MSELDPNSVKDRETFAAFVRALIADRKRAEASEASSAAPSWGSRLSGWENVSISSFLESALAGSLDQLEWGTSSGVSWRDLAVFLYLGKIYE